MAETRHPGVHERIDALTDEQAIKLTEQYSTHNYHPLPINIVRAEGIYAWDGSGKRYFDCIGSYSAVANGHLSPSVVAAVTEQLNRVTLTSRAVYTSELACFVEKLCEYTGMDMACPMNTGAEAVETAIKLARKWAYTVKGVPADKAEIIVATDNFHGRTTTIVGFSTESQYREHFGPYGPGFHLVPFGDLVSLASAIGDNTAAVLLEPIQAEGGILFPPPDFMAHLRKLCTEKNVLLIWDEIQTGFCRTGKRFAWQHEDAEPDLLCLGKALGGGVMPVAAVVGKRHVMEVFKPGDHGSTFGGNPLASVVGIAAMTEMEESRLDERSAEMGERFLEGLKSLNHPCVDDVRGRGLLIGLEVTFGTDTNRLTRAFLDGGILTKETRSRTFRFAPPLVVTAPEVDEIVRRISVALDEVGAAPATISADTAP
jgi:ornithine--oxo-acid transaminase